MSSQAIRPIKCCNRYPVCEHKRHSEAEHRATSKVHVRSTCSFSHETDKDRFQLMLTSFKGKHNGRRLQSTETRYVSDHEVWPSLPPWEQKIKGYGQTMWAVRLPASAQTVCVYCMHLCVSTHSKSVTFFLWLHACKRLFVSIWQKQFASWILWTAGTMFLLIREWQRKKEREKKTGSPTDETETNLL